MNVLGIIAEYNPFHNGHAYQIETLKKETGAAYAIIAMGGNFMQRGAPALLEKYTRAKMALSCGADLVLELPALYACASAESFAYGGAALLEGTGVVTHLGFGTETEHLPILQEIAGILTRQPQQFRQTLQQGLKQGLSFPAARSLAVKNCLALSCSKGENCPSAELGQILSSPNNILAIEYLKALSRCHSSILPSPLLRRGQRYHDQSPGQEFPSASAIRASIWEPGSLPLLKHAMPAPAFAILKDYPHPFLQEDDFSALLHYKLLTESPEQLSRYADSSPSLAQRIKKEENSFLSWSSFCQRLKTKNITYTRLSRIFLHMLLNIHTEGCSPLPPPSYLRVLGFCKQSAPLLAAIKTHGSLPLLTSPASAPKLLPAPAQALLAHDLAASNLYRIGLAAKGDNTLKNDYQHPIVLT